MNGEQAGPGLGYREASEKGSRSMEKTPAVGGGLPAAYMEGQGSQGSQASGSSWPLGGSRGVASRRFGDWRELLRRRAPPCRAPP